MSSGNTVGLSIGNGSLQYNVVPWLSTLAVKEAGLSDNTPAAENAYCRFLSVPCYSSSSFGEFWSHFCRRVPG